MRPLKQRLRAQAAARIFQLGEFAQRSRLTRQFAFAIRQRFPRLGYWLFSIYKRLKYGGGLPLRANSAVNQTSVVALDSLARVYAENAQRGHLSDQRSPLESYVSTNWTRP